MLLPAGLVPTSELTRTVDHPADERRGVRRRKVAHNTQERVARIMRYVQGGGSAWLPCKVVQTKKQHIVPAGIQHCTVLYCTVLYCTVEYCTVSTVLTNWGLRLHSLNLGPILIWDPFY